MPADDTTPPVRAPDSPLPQRPHVGTLLALSDEHRRGLHAERPDRECSRCLIAALEAADDHPLPRDIGD